MISKKSLICTFNIKDISESLKLYNKKKTSCAQLSVYEKHKITILSIKSLLILSTYSIKKKNLI